MNKTSARVSSSQPRMKHNLKSNTKNQESGTRLNTESAKNNAIDYYKRSDLPEEE